MTLSTLTTVPPRGADLRALSVHIEEGKAGLRNVSGRHPLVMAVHVDVKAVLTVHQHPHPAPRAHGRQVTAIVLLHLNPKPEATH